jgi:hypothetical protein
MPVLSASWCTPTIYAPERTSTRRVSTSNVPLSSLHQNHGVLPWGWHLIPLPPSYIVPKGVSSSSEPPRFVVVNSIRPCPTGRKSRHHRSVLLEASSISLVPPIRPQRTAIEVEALMNPVTAAQSRRQRLPESHLSDLASRKPMVLSSVLCAQFPFPASLIFPNRLPLRRLVSPPPGISS